MEVLGLFKMRDAIGLFLVALDASSKQESFIFTITIFFCKQNAMKDKEKLKLCEIRKGWIQVGKALHVKVLYLDNCTA